MSTVKETRPGTDQANRAKSKLFRASSVILTLFVVGSAILFFVRNRGEIHQAVNGVVRADARWLAVTLLAQLMAIVLVAVKYQVLLRRLGYRLSTADTARLQVRRQAVSSVMPFGGASSLVTFARDLGRAGVAREDAVFTAGLSSLVSEVAFALFLLPVLAALAATGKVTGRMLIGSVILVGLVALLVVALLMVCRSGNSSAWRRHLPRKLVGTVERASGHGLGAHDLFLPVGLNLGVNVASVATLLASCHAVGVDPSLWAVVVGRAIGSVFMLIAPFMQGAGAVELSVTAILRQAGVPSAPALASVLIFRVAQFWFPLAIGAMAYLRLDGFASAVRQRKVSTPAATAVCATSLVVAMLLTGPDLDQPTMEDEEGIFWVMSLGIMLLLAWIVAAAPAARLCRAWGRHRSD